MRAYLKRTGFIVMMTVILTMIAALCIGITATSKSEITKQEQENYYREQEKEYVKRLRTYLETTGYPDSGVTMTRTTEADGTVTYTTTIHHTRIDRLTPDEQQKLLSEIQTIEIPGNNATVFHKFLTPNH